MRHAAQHTRPPVRARLFALVLLSCVPLTACFSTTPDTTETLATSSDPDPLLPICSPTCSNGMRCIAGVCTEGVVQLDAGSSHACALFAEGRVFCWGHAAYGQLGHGQYQGGEVPVEVSLTERVTQIATGGAHTCALLESGQVACWGANSMGQLARKGTPAEPSPMLIEGLHDVRQLAAGVGHTCAVTNDNALQCWGLDSHGQLGSRRLERHLPDTVSGLEPGVDRVATGSIHTCALLTNTEVRCWGYGADGQLGNEDTASQRRPASVSRARSEEHPPGVPLMVLSSVVDIVAGGAHTCALRDDGLTFCWGSNLDGEAGVESPDARITKATPTDFPEPVVALSAGHKHTCALLESGRVVCLGDGLSGQLGNAITSSRRGPRRLAFTAVSELPAPVRLVAAGGKHSCALAADDQVYCWGSDSRGQLGSLTEESFTESALRVGVGAEHACALAEDGRVRCFGSNLLGQLGTGQIGFERLHTLRLPDDANPALDLAVGKHHSCLLGSDGLVYCWGANDFGQTGAPTEDSGHVTLTPTPVANLDDGVVRLTAGGEHTCALLASGEARCWGANHQGQLGDGEVGGETPTPRAALSDVVHLDAGPATTCAALRDGSVRCWGALPEVDEPVAEPRQVEGVEGALSVSVGLHHGCALLGEGRVRCWGRNTAGQLGVTEPDATLTDVPDITDAVIVSAGGWHTCALLRSGTGRCWGRNRDGQLGGGEKSRASEPVTVGTDAEPTRLTSLDAGLMLSCFLHPDGHLECTRNDLVPELPKRKLESSRAPVPVFLKKPSEEE